MRRYEILLCYMGFTFYKATTYYTQYIKMNWKGEGHFVQVYSNGMISVFSAYKFPAISGESYATFCMATITTNRNRNDYGVYKVLKQCNIARR